jgi:hypothetical protein
VFGSTTKVETLFEREFVTRAKRTEAGVGCGDGVFDEPQPIITSMEKTRLRQPDAIFLRNIDIP